MKKEPKWLEKIQEGYYDENNTATAGIQYKNIVWTQFIKPYLLQVEKQAKEKMIKRIEKMIFLDTDGVHSVMVWRIDTNKFDKLKEEYEK